MKHFFLLLIITSVISCSKEGPAGPQGDAGIQGPQGIPGAQGPAGPAGSANVIYSDWLNYNLEPGVYSGLFYGKLNAPKLTQAILDKGDIKLYITNGSSVWSLPFPTMPGYYFRYSVGTIELFSPQDWDSFSGYKIRYILVPGAVRAKGSTALDWNDYEAVKRHYNIPG